MVGKSNQDSTITSSLTSEATRESYPSITVSSFLGWCIKSLSTSCGEDVDALISVTSDEDLEHMMIEFDRLHRASAKAAKLRFIVPSEVKSERQLFVDALDSVRTKFVDTQPSQPTVPEVVVKDVSAGSECGSEDRKLIGDAFEAFKQQTLDLRLHFAGNNEQRKSDEACSRGFLDEYYAQKLTGKMTPGM
ncbi:hypothetical protein NC653_006141 [Populus alba x Populus x berolinensis]|uniref:PB1 domain-containing protein n=1 Tax=Populus alba x Populus x berolinensis TaxID=444605 RepID=A0AAD6RDJ3_9ROSI|nr:hypothetical protein NC653_006141 [Populus alba x Populus x berolinensis]